MLWMNQTVGAMRCSPCTPRRVVPLMVEESIEGDGVTRNTMGDGVTRNTVIILNAFLPSLYIPVTLCPSSNHALAPSPEMSCTPQTFLSHIPPAPTPVILTHPDVAIAGVLLHRYKQTPPFAWTASLLLHRYKKKHSFGPRPPDRSRSRPSHPNEA